MKKEKNHNKEILIRVFAHAIKDIIEYIPGPDMGTDERCMYWVKSEIGRAVGLPREIGGIPLDEIGATGFGLSVCAEVASSFCDVNLEGARIVIQGFGSVGQHAARFLAAKDAVLVAAADSQGTIFNPQGIDIEHLIQLKNVGKSVIDYSQGEKLEQDAVIAIPCDIWIPAARPDVIHSDNVDRLQTKLVLQGANIPFTAEAERICHQRHILIVPDFIANAGGVICGAVEYAGGNQQNAFQAIEKKIRQNSTLVLETATKTGIQPREVAVEIAKRRACNVMKWWE
ncbi:glutamate dehydrogenase [Calothrix rhizosoleniae]|uniref:glutamate dehydrogenase n=1 Tax=Calothrix rhizosoleniae TaxID=888997 RepID=UPI000B49D435|nr:glutamate dehydrogenase [Calothrix rhizosoleniae]